MSCERRLLCVQPGVTFMEKDERIFHCHFISFILSRFLISSLCLESTIPFIFMIPLFLSFLSAEVKDDRLSPLSFRRGMTTTFNELWSLVVFLILVVGCDVYGGMEEMTTMCDNESKLGKRG